MFKCFLLLKISITLACMCSGETNSILLKSRIQTNHFIEMGCTCVFKLHQLNETPLYCTKDEEEIFPVVTDNFTSIQISFDNLSTSGLYMCEQTIKLQQPRRYGFKITVYVPPRSAVLYVNYRNVFSVVVSKPFNLNCSSFGMSPPGQIQLLLEDRLINGVTSNSTDPESHLYNVFSFVEVIPTWENDRSNVVCKVYQPQVNVNYNNTKVESVITLQILIEFHHQSSLDLGYKTIEGDDVNLNCSSNYPYNASYSWKHLESGYVVANRSVLNIRNITCIESGRYICTVKPEKERDSAKVSTNIIVTCFPQPPSDLEVVRIGVDYITLEWTPNLHSKQQQYIVEWKGIDGDEIGNTTLPTPHKFPPFLFTIENVNSGKVFIVGVYGINKLGRSVTLSMNGSNSSSDYTITSCQNIDKVYSIVPIYVSIFMAGVFIGMCVNVTVRRIKKNRTKKSAKISTYMQYLPKQEETTYEDLDKVAITLGSPTTKPSTTVTTGDLTTAYENIYKNTAIITKTKAEVHQTDHRKHFKH